MKTPVWKLFAAFLYDIFPVLGIFLLTSLLVLLFRNGVEVERFSPWFIFILVAELGFYYIYSWKKGGQTLGMRAWKFKIIPNRANQRTISWHQASTRFVVGIFSTLLIGAGFFWKLLSKDNQSWMDLVSNSKTIMLDE